MPLLKFRCTACGAVFDTLISAARIAEVRCEACGDAVERAYEGACLFGMVGASTDRGQTCDRSCAASPHGGGCGCGHCHG